MFSATMEYALRATVYLAAQDGKPCVNKDIAAAVQVPVDYLAKILQNLRRAGIVDSRRGIKGGFVLKRPANEISVLDVVNSIEPVPRITHCPLSLSEHQDHLCPLHKHLDEAAAMLNKLFANHTIAEMVVKTNANPHQKPDVFAQLSGSPSKE